MNKIPVLTIALLLLFLMAIPQVMATQKGWYYCEIEADQVPADSEQWNSGEIILHFEDHWVGTYDGTLGDGSFEAWTYMMLSFKTGKGTFTATWLITIGANTIAGSASGKVTAYGMIITGTFIGTDGTGDFEGIKKSGSFVMTVGAEIPGHASMVAWGTIIGYP